MATTPPDDDTRPSPDDDDPGEAVQELRARLEERDREVEELRAEIARRDEQRRQAGRLALMGGKISARIVAWFFIGRGLADGMRRWFNAIKHWLTEKPSLDSFPLDATADVAAAIVRRVVRVGLVGLLLAALPTILLIWQNILLQNQIRQQAADTLIVRRAQLLDTIYTQECEDAPKAEDAAEEQDVAGERAEPTSAPAEPLCKPKANPRAVREAVLAFVEIERGRGETSDLRWANLREVNLSQADLSEASLFEGDLRDAFLFEADLHDAFLFGADLRGVGLNEANLREANLFRADLSGAILEEADLGGANLREANLHGAYLRETRFLAPEQLAGACGDKTTMLPEGFEMPGTWPCRWEENEFGGRVRVPLENDSR